MLIFLLIIFEGAIRKWILPSLSGPLFFVKDPIVLLVYLLVFKYRLNPRSRLYKISLLMLGLFFFGGFLQIVLNAFSPLVLLIGFRNYFLLLPLTFIIAEHFTKEDLVRFARITCWIALPTVILVFLQYHSPPEAFINKNVGEGESTRVFTVARGIVRVSGFFSFTSGHSLYVLIFIGFLFFNYFLPKKERFLPSIVYVTLLLIAPVLVIYAGSRGLVANVLILCFFVMLAALLSLNRRSSFRVWGLFIVGGALMYFLTTTFLAENVAVLAGRFEAASRSEDTIYRFFSSYIEVFKSFGLDVPLWGLGLGIGSNAGAFLMSGTRGFVTAESEWQSVMAEAGPLLGSVFIVYRIFLSVSSLYASFMVFRKKGIIVPVIFSAMVFMLFLSGQITKQGTSMYFAWLFIGLAMAANRIYSLERTPVQVDKVKTSEALNVIHENRHFFSS